MNEARGFQVHNRNPMKVNAASFDEASRRWGPWGNWDPRLCDKYTLFVMGFFFFLSQPTIRYFQTFACRCTRHQVSFTFTFSLRKCVWDTNLLLLINCKRAFKSQRSRSVFQSGPAFTVSDYFISFISSRHRFSAIYERPTPHPSSLTDHK